jgi:hypothetical protein
MTEPGRDPAFEREFIELIFRRTQIWDQTLFAKQTMDHVFERLAKGADEYGPGSFLDKNLGREIEEEAADIIAWGMLDAIKARDEGDMRRIEVRLRQATHGLAALMEEYNLRNELATT